ncbi:MAG: DNA repair protein RecN [Candidatus Dormibacteria bacterium]
MALRELRVGNLAVIEDTRLSFDEGFSVLTGETGSGKSMCVNALRAALGGRLEPETVRAGAVAARVAAVFDNPSPRLRSRRAELGIPDDDLITLSREVPASGRAVCRIDGALVSQTVLRELGDLCVDVTAQGTSHRMLRRSWQRDVLDAFGGTECAAARSATAAAVQAWRAATEATAAARRAASTGAAELQRARDLVDDLGNLSIRAGEDVDLQTERLRLRHASRIAGCALALADASGGDEQSFADRLAAAIGAGADLAAVDPHLAMLLEEADALVDRLRELALDARRHADEITVDEARLTAIEERLDTLARVTRRHGSLEAAIAELDRATALVTGFDGEAGAIGTLETAAEACRAEAGRAAGRLSAVRTSAARRLERAVTTELRSLELPHARFRVVLTRNLDVDGVNAGDETPVHCGPAGIDEVDFRLAPNRDAVPMPLDEGPSGGELGRLALALSAVVSEEDAPVLVLDEVDTGIGGETAARVGDVLARIGRTRQVIAITHRPEIAARAAAHLTITKVDRPGGPVATAAAVSGAERVTEIARLMSGRTTAAALTRAAELLEEGAGGVRGIPGVRTM